MKVKFEPGPDGSATDNWNEPLNSGDDGQD
ncbi:hypothetical protein CJ469_04724 [Nocardia farcinica]|nr:hypothetical protein CJ469_04724 [Nocardia farcinica]PFX07741.1 hypothetical protein CJ468_03403 [Nocardia farcinica]